MYQFTGIIAIGLSLAGLLASAARADDALVIRKDKKNVAALAAKQPAPAKTVTGKKAKSVGRRAGASRHKPRAITLTLKPGESPAVAWNNYFALHGKESGPAAGAHPADIRETVRQLAAAKKYDEVSALIQAAIRNGQPQWWMYQALGLALQMNGSPRSEVERALMSSLEMVRADPAQLSFIAHYLASYGFDDRALEVYRQIALIEPTNPMAYRNGLQIAARLADAADALANAANQPGANRADRLAASEAQLEALDAIQWATVGVLSQGWTSKQRTVLREALNQAKATLARLRSQKRTKEAAEYQKSLNEAVKRDLVVVVRWTGNADVDLSMEEPAGTLCSARHPRTTSGGVMLGNSFALRGKESKNGYREYYVCPKGFSGTYRLTLQRVWGKITSGTVKVQVYSHYRSKNQKRFTRTYKLGDANTIVEIDLKDGRREEPLGEREVVQVARNQAVVAQAILRQQLGALNDPRIDQRFRASRGIGGFGLGDRNQARALAAAGLLPFGARGAVGYRPIITTLPEGANMAATVVISPDRRYVRITASPLFSSIGRVLTFSITTGVIGNGDPPLDGDDGGGGDFGGGDGGGGDLGGGDGAFDAGGGDDGGGDIAF